MQSWLSETLSEPCEILDKNPTKKDKASELGWPLWLRIWPCLPQGSTRVHLLSSDLLILSLSLRPSFPVSPKFSATHEKTETVKTDFLVPIEKTIFAPTRYPARSRPSFPQKFAALAHSSFSVPPALWHVCFFVPWKEEKKGRDKPEKCLARPEDVMSEGKRGCCKFLKGLTVCLLFSWMKCIQELAARWKVRQSYATKISSYSLASLANLFRRVAFYCSWFIPLYAYSFWIAIFVSAPLIWDRWGGPWKVWWFAQKSAFIAARPQRTSS